MYQKQSKWTKYNEDIKFIVQSHPEWKDSKVAAHIAAIKGFEYQDTFRTYIRRYRAKNKVSRANPHGHSKKINKKNEWDFKEESAQWSYEGEQSITTLQQAITFSKADTSKWTVERWKFNSWDVTSKEGKRTNYQVTVWFKAKDEKQEEIFENFYTQIKAQLRHREIPQINLLEKDHKVGVIPLADFHIGAYIRGLLNTQNYDIDTVVNMLDEVAIEINKQGYSEVHIALLGDIIESFTGTNHENTFKSIGFGQYGFNVFISAYEILENFLGKINNLVKVYGVSGNHDRHTASNKLDTEGDVLKGLMYFLDQRLEVEVQYHPLVINAVIDGISYVLTHGHHGLARKSIEKIILDYGIQGMYNVVLQGHWHKRGNKKPVITNTETIYSDSALYMGVICPSLFTGNFFSEALGYTSNAGFLQFWNKNDKVCMLDTPLG
jgi:predicted phosphodiesterase